MDLFRFAPCLLGTCLLVPIAGGLQNLEGSSGDSAGQISSAELDARIDLLISRLANPSFQAREAARWELQRIGLAAFDKLLQARDHREVEIAAAARFLLNSQRVIWSLESDSLAVRQLLRDYNDLAEIERLSRMQQLAELNTSDSVAALVRLARYEINDRLAKSAALCLMEKFFDAHQVLDKPSIVAHIREGTTGRLRPSTNWLRQFASVLDEDSTDHEPWQDFVTGEHRLLGSGSKTTNDKIVGRLYDWIGHWLARLGSRELALQISIPRLDLVTGDTAILRFAHWALDAGLPELVERLAQANADKFDSHSQLRYLLAECYFKLGKEDRWRIVAQEASDRVGKNSKTFRSLRGNAADDVAVERAALSERLWDRGMFDWAETELKRALELELSPSLEIRLRFELVDFYWDAARNDAAASVIEAVVKKANENPNFDDQLRRDARSDALNSIDDANGNWHFYSGLAAIDRGDVETARRELDLAFEVIRDNPDILIAMHRIGGDGKYRENVDARIEQMIATYREEIQKNEHNLARANQMDRRTGEAELAASCNQLAWLLSCTRRSPSEAVALSQRSLTLSPNSSTYLDTLGRCYFEASLVQKAVDAQSRAVRLEPYRRQMQRQLAEFLAAEPGSQGKPASADPRK